MRKDVALCLIVTGTALVAVRGTNGKTCWEGPWFNDTSPSLHNGTDSETQTTTVLQSICPDGSPVVDAHCKDEKGEPFRIFKNDTANKYVATCTVATGLQCKPYNNTPGAACADFAIQYGCSCPTTPVTAGAFTTPKGVVSGSPVGSGSSGSGSDAGSSTGGSGFGAVTTSKTEITTGLGGGGTGSAGNGSGGTQTGSGSSGNGQEQSLGSKCCTCRNGSDKYRLSMLNFLFLLFAFSKFV